MSFIFGLYSAFMCVCSRLPTVFLGQEEGCFPPNELPKTVLLYHVTVGSHQPNWSPHTSA